MYAVVSTGGKQYKVAKGDLIDVEKLNAEPGDKVALDVLMLNDGKKTTVAGLEKTQIECTVVDHHKGEKQLVFKFHKRKRYQRTKGHRQNYTRLEVGDIPASARKRSTTKKAAEAEDATKKSSAAKTTTKKATEAKTTAAKSTTKKTTAAKTTTKKTSAAKSTTKKTEAATSSETSE